MQDFNNQIGLEKNNYSISYDSLIDPPADDLLLYSLETVDETVWLLSNENIIDNSNQGYYKFSLLSNEFIMDLSFEKFILIAKFNG